MRKNEFKKAVFDLFSTKVDGVTYDEKILLIEKHLVDFQRENEDKRDTTSKGDAWKDSELRIILSDAPTIQNSLKYAKLFNRGFGSIEQIYRWAATSIEDFPENRANDSFLLQIKRIAKELGWRA